MWWQGLDNAPAVVKRCINNLKENFDEAAVHVVSEDNYKEYTSISPVLVTKFEEGNISLTNWSDIVRFNILNQNGGLWVDATVLLSKKFCKYLLNNERDFFSLCSAFNYHWISGARWTVWLMGGKPNYELFSYICIFFETYFSQHNYLIDYFLLDDIIFHYYSRNKDFQKECQENLKNWHPYYFANNFSSKFNSNMIKLFENNIEYGVQKLTYKYDTKLLDDSDNLLSYLLEKIEE